MKKKRNYIGLLFTTTMTILLGILKYFGILPWKWYEVVIPFAIGLLVWIGDMLIRYFELRSLNYINKAIKNRNHTR